MSSSPSYGTALCLTQMWLVDKRQIIEGPGGYTFNVLEHLAGISPYFDSPGVQLDPTPPDGCTVSKSTYIVRHSNIYANDVSI